MLRTAKQGHQTLLAAGGRATIELTNAVLAAIVVDDQRKNSLLGIADKGPCHGKQSPDKRLQPKLWPPVHRVLPCSKLLLAHQPKLALQFF